MKKYLFVFCFLLLSIKLFSNDTLIQHKSGGNEWTYGKSDYISIEKEELSIDIPLYLKRDVKINNVSYGKYIIIKTGQYKLYTKYFLLAHLDRNSFSLKKGDKVYPGSICGYVGNTGHCQTTHLKKYKQSEYDKKNYADFKDKNHSEHRNLGLGAHLHLQLFLSNKPNDDSFIESIRAKENGGPIQRGVSIFNPFNYEEAYFNNK